MPIEPMPVELLEYASDLFAPEDAALKALTRAAQEAGMPAGWEITPDVGRLFQVLCRAVGARKVVEFGTLAGHSALWFARALPEEGKVYSIEINPEYAAVARRELAKAGVGEKVEVRVGAGRDMLPALEREVRESRTPFDAIFLDADKAHYPEFLAWSVRVLRPGGLLLADNVLRSGSWGGQTLLDPTATDPRIPAIREFNRLLATHPQFTATLVPIRAGVAVGIFHGSSALV
ncbi:MAG TPA: O-methyltransferase [Chthonomonadaceae bacterium]|nr:O-methyltransferase [Chthonomonadaceae bacterium]